MNEMITYTVPARFFGDCEDNCVNVGTAIGTNGRRLIVRGTTEQREELLDRARYYCDKDGPDWCPPGIKQSARATIKALS